MAPRKTEAAASGLRLTLPGAPATAHNIPGVPGWFWPNRPTPVGGHGDLVSLEQARALDADPGMHLELVELTAGEYREAREYLEQHARVAAGALRAIARHTDGDERERVAEQLAATAGAVDDAEKE